MKIDKEFQNLIPKLTTEEFSELEKSILKDGCRDAICLWKEPSEKVGTGIILDGHNRYKICMKHSLPSNKIWIKLENRNEAKSWIIQNQFARRNLNKFQRAELVLKLEEIIAEQAKERQRKGGRNKVVEIFPQPKTRDVLGEKSNLSGKTIDKVKIIKKEATEEIIEKLRDGEVSVDAAFKEIKREEKIEKRKEEITKQKKAIEKGIIKPTGLFDVIVLDPPWAYDDKFDPDTRQGTVPYPTMTQEQMKQIKIPAKKNSVIFLWTTHKHIFNAKELLDEYGYDYKATIVWDKESIGIGKRFRYQLEFCLVGIKGKPFWENIKYSELIREKRREHSRKPEAFYELVDKITMGEKLDYFSRCKREGWVTIGSDLNKFEEK